MHIIKFKVDGVFNSFRVPFFRTYQKTFLAPPKTTILGMITNIMKKPEEFFYKILNDDTIKISVIINNINGKVKDLWTYKTFESKSGMHGKSIIRRDHLFNAQYTIYIMLENEQLSKDIYSALLYPKSIPSLGLDDEIVKIYDVECNVDIKENKSDVINSVFMDKGYEYEVKIKDLFDAVEMPTANEVPLKYEIGENEGVRSARKGSDVYKQVEFLNCYVQINNVKSFICGDDRLIFY
ncbi:MULTISPECIES: CRISPR-associated protein Cas5 [Clostridium]|uniref:CRISPR-associated protein Cas5 n=1 Tax=Clostridium TaxID=1485 RepID=UPI000825D8C2|nr:MULTISPECIES: CRISPR-associated protein Cas5 [Clostridium]PJI07103.1 CRISPR-associated protein Cas5 [Clostridium sp. CT7]